MVGSSQDILDPQLLFFRDRFSIVSQFGFFAGGYRSGFVKNYSVYFCELFYSQCIFEVEFLSAQYPKNVSKGKRSCQRQSTWAGYNQYCREYIESDIGIDENPIGKSRKGNY